MCPVYSKFKGRHCKQRNMNILDSRMWNFYRKWSFTDTIWCMRILVLWVELIQSRILKCYLQKHKFLMMPNTTCNKVKDKSWDTTKIGHVMNRIGPHPDILSRWNSFFHCYKIRYVLFKDLELEIPFPRYTFYVNYSQ